MELAQVINEAEHFFKGMKLLSKKVGDLAVKSVVTERDP